MADQIQSGRHCRCGMSSVVGGFIGIDQYEWIESRVPITVGVGHAGRSDVDTPTGRRYERSLITRETEFPMPGGGKGRDADSARTGASPVGHAVHAALQWCAVEPRKPACTACPTKLRNCKERRCKKTEALGAPPFACFRPRRGDRCLQQAGRRISCASHHHPYPKPAPPTPTPAPLAPTPTPTGPTPT
jgi:hypothetical protein